MRAAIPRTKRKAPYNTDSTTVQRRSEIISAMPHTKDSVLHRNSLGEELRDPGTKTTITRDKKRIFNGVENVERSPETMAAIQRVKDRSLHNNGLVKKQTSPGTKLPVKHDKNRTSTGVEEEERSSETVASTVPHVKKSTVKTQSNVLETDHRIFDKETHTKPCQRYPPKAIVIGVTKCGTGPLRMFLNAHPDIDNAPVGNGVGRTKSVNYFYSHYKEGASWYINQMPCSEPDRMIIDHTPQYFRREAIPKRIYMFNSTIKLILLVREPISRTVSQYLQSREQYLESREGRRGEQFGTSDDVESFLLDESRKKIDTDNFAVSASAYYIHIQKWLKFFPLSQFHIIDVLELAKQPVKPLKELEKFLGVSSYFDSDTVYFNETRGFHCVKAYGKPGKFICGVPNKGRQHPQLSDTTYNLLKEYFDPLNEQFFKAIGKEYDWTTTKRNTLSPD